MKGLLFAIVFSLMAGTVSASEEKVKTLPPPKKVELKDIVAIEGFDNPESVLAVCDWEMGLEEVRECYETQYQKLQYLNEIATTYKSIKEKLEEKSEANGNGFAFNDAQPPFQQSNSSNESKSEQKTKVVYVKPKVVVSYMGSVSDDNGAIGFATVDKTAYTFKKGGRVGKYKVLNFDNNCMKLSNNKTYCK